MIQTEDECLLSELAFLWQPEDADDTIILAHGDTLYKCPQLQKQEKVAIKNKIKYQKYQYSPNQDMFSLGLTIFELINFYNPYSDKVNKNPKSTIQNMLNDESEPRPFARRVDKDFEKIIYKMISKDPKERPSSFKTWFELKSLCESKGLEMDNIQETEDFSVDRTNAHLSKTEFPTIETETHDTSEERMELMVSTLL